MEIELYDRKKLLEARRLVFEVYGYYYSSPNSRVICGRMATIIHKLDELLTMREAKE